MTTLMNFEDKPPK